MSRNVSMQFGRSGGVVQNRPGLKFIKGAEMTDSTATDVLSFSPGGLYLLFCKEWNASTSAFRGARVIYIAAPEEDIFGTTAISRANVYASTNSGVTLTNNNDSTLSIKQSSATYNLRYALYRVDGSGGAGVQSTIEPYIGVYSVTPSTTPQSLSTANKRMTADVEVAEIPTDYGQVTQNGSTLTIT